jgi:hypothetical protein
MKCGKWFAAVGMLLILCGCYVQSLNPFYTDKNKIALAEINGDWFSTVQIGKSVANKKVAPWRFTQKTVTTFDEDNVCSVLDVVYFKAGKNTFIDVTAGAPMRSENIFWNSGVILAHTVCRIEQANEEMTITPLNYKWVKDNLKEIGLSYVQPKAKDSNFIFTCTSEDWEKFLEKYGDNKEAFNPDCAFVFKRTLK